MTAADPFALPRQEDATPQRLVRIGGWAVWVIGSAIALLLLLDRPIEWLHVALNGLAGLMGGVSLLFGLWRKPRAAALVLVWGVWAAASLVTAVNGGIRGPNLLNYPVLIVFSGWVLGLRLTLWVIGATAVLFLLLVWGDMQGWIPPAHFENRLAYLAYFAGVLGLTGAATLLSRRSYERRVEEARRELAERQRADAEIHRLAHFDALTGLPNRLALMKRLDSLQHRPGRGPGAVHGLLLIDLDRFTMLNNARGNEAGDRLLRAMARRLEDVLPGQSLLVRVAADEFAIVLQGLGADAIPAGRQTLAFVQAVLLAVRQPLPLEGTNGEVRDEVHMDASVGMTLYPQGGEDDAAEALRRAGTALHRIKQAGGGGFAFFEEGMGAAAEQRFLIERELHHAIGAGELRVFLQSQVDGAGALVGAEALVRWQHPQRGLLSPAAFIPVAEETDLIVSLGGWVLEQACALLALPAMRERRLRLSVNLSARQFRQEGFVPGLRQLLQHSGADASLLTLEVTEGLVIEDFDATVAKMQELAELGVEFSVDDFGTGYSSLAYLKRLPIQELKIDKSFVHEAPTEKDDAVLVESILSVARHFGLRVVAEGVETPAQAQFLRERAPDIVCQGYLYARPEPQAAWLDRLAGQALREMPTATP